MSKRPAALLELAGCFAVPHSGRGRPALDSLPMTDRRLRRGGPMIARLVFETELRIGTQRGAMAAAINEVARRLHVPVATVKKHAARHRAQRLPARQRAAVARDVAEFDRRTLGLPDDVMSALAALPLGRVLQRLRDSGVDGTCPQWLADAARRGDFLSPK